MASRPASTSGSKSSSTSALADTRRAAFGDNSSPFTVTLWPLSQGEIDAVEEQFAERLLSDPAAHLLTTMVQV